MTLLVEDAALRARFRAGEPEALATVFRHYAPRVAALLRRGFSFTSGEQHVRFKGYEDLFELEDVVQEVFRRAFSEHARTTYDGLRPFGAYVATIAKNLAINDFVSKRRRLLDYDLDTERTADDASWSAAEDPLAEATSPRGKPEHDAEAAELHRLVGIFRDGLTERERTIFTLRFSDGLSHTELGARTGFTPAQIKTTEARIRKALWRYLRGHGYLEHAERLASRAAALPLTRGDES